MKRWLPSSLLGQVMAAACAALLVAQGVSAALLYRASEERREVAALTGLAFQLAAGPDWSDRPRPARRTGAGREPGALLAPGSGRLPRRLRYTAGDQPAISAAEAARESRRAGRLGELLAAEGVPVHELRLARRAAASDPDLAAFAQARPRLARRTGWRERELFVASLQRAPGGAWETARVFEVPRPRGGAWLLAGQTLVIFAFLMTILYFMLRRITRPLQLLTERVDSFSRAPGSAVALEETGPADTRRLIAAHNAMEARIAALIDEKDVMLGAIGHDLKTPLAALRVRIESVPDEAQRSRMAAGIEDITRTLDDILELARIGRKRDETAALHPRVDIGALVQGVVEEFGDLGQPVDYDPPPGRMVARAQETLAKRALRNLVSNALRYGGGARVAVLERRGETGAQIVLRIEDDGPGIPADEIGAMLEPFRRGEASRNRATGGAGLGLTLARAIAEAHGGELALVNRAEGGLRAEIRLPGGE